MGGTRGLLLCGLGARAPEETTVETLQALERSRLVLCDVDSPGLIDWLRPFCRRLVVLPAGGETGAAARRVLKEAAAGGAALAVWGHPVISSALGRETLALAKRSRTPVEVLGAVSPAGSAFARSVSFLGGDYGYHGIQSCGLEALASGAFRVDPALPAVLYAGSPAAGAAWPRAAARLLKRYPAGHRCWVFGPVDDEAPAPATALSVLAGEPSLRGHVLLIPPVSRPGSDAKG